MPNMIARAWCAWLACLLAAASSAVSADASRWWSHVKMLADDSMEGRATGTPGHQRAAEYVADQFRIAGLEPAGTNGFFQPVKFNRRRIDEAHSKVAIVAAGRAEPFTLGEDGYVNVRVDPAPSVDAPLVFVGYGLTVPEMKVDDLGDAAVKAALKDSIAVYLAGGPPNVPLPLRAHYQSGRERWQALKRAGAIGTMVIPDPRVLDFSWDRLAQTRLQPSLTLADPSLDDAAGFQLSLTMRPARAEKLFQGSGHTLADILDLADAGKALPHFALATRVQASVRVDRAQIESANVVGLLRGVDPRRQSQYVAVTAHLDHLGVGEAADGMSGDRIYNGAMDNASGTAAVIEVASTLHAKRRRPARSLLFVAMTGEEDGELGSRYFVAHPPVPPASIVANLNTDMFLPLFPLKTLMVLGLDESDLGRDVRAVAAARKLAVQADPEPGRNRFIRSDQYSFTLAGIPALAMKVGYETDSAEAEIAGRWNAERYHAPSDDLSQPIDMSAAGAFVDVVGALATRIANRSNPPVWNTNSFFKRFATPPPK